MQTRFIILLFILFWTIALKLCTGCLLNLCGLDAPSRTMLAQPFEGTSSAHDLDEVGTLSGIRSLFLLPRYSDVALGAVQSPYVFPLMWDMTTRKRPSWHPGTKPVNAETPDAFEETSRSR